MRTWAVLAAVSLAVFLLGGCGIARSASLRQLAVENAPLPPDGKQVSTKTRPLLLNYTYPTVTVVYTSPQPPAEVAAYYTRLLASKGWENFQQGDHVGNVPAMFRKPEMQIELRVGPQAREAGNAGGTEVTIMISTKHPWEYALGSWVQQAILACRPHGDHPVEPALLDVIGLF